MKIVLSLVASLVIAISLLACSSLQPTHLEGGQQATPQGKQLLAVVDSANGAIQAGAPAAQAALGPVLAPIAGALVLLIGYGVKRLHDKLDDLTPETPVITTVPANKPTG